LGEVMIEIQTQNGFHVFLNFILSFISVMNDFEAAEAFRVISFLYHKVFIDCDLT